MLKTPEELEEYFPGSIAFTDCNEQQIPRPVDKRRHKAYHSLGKKKIHTAIKNQIVVNNHGYIFHKLGHKEGRRHIIICKNIKESSVTPKDVLKMCIIFDI